MREFRQKHGRSGERYWMIGFEAEPGAPVETIVTEWGAIKDGKRKQHGKTKDRPGPKGKEGTKGWVSAQDNACFNSDRLIRKKVEEGYVEVGLDGRSLVGGSADEIVHDQPLPKNLCFSKPRNSISQKALLKLEQNDDLILTRKYNGMMVIAHIDREGDAHIYSRRMDEVTGHFPHLERALGRTGMAFPPESILLFEAFLGEGCSQDEFEAVQSVMRSKEDRAVRLQQENGWVKFYLFRVPIWKGAHLEEINTCEQQCLLIENTFTDRFLDNRNTAVDGQFLFPLENVEVSVSEALGLAERYGWEGFVGYQKSATMAGYSFSFHGKPDRPGCCFKLKPVYEDDFVAYWEPEKGTKEMPRGSYGSGKNSDTVGTISLYQYNEAGELIYICECSGFTEEDREYLAKAAEYPTTVQIEFTSRSYVSRGRKSNALQFPRFSRMREDKEPEECVNPVL
jgi:hypothetical protein